MELQNKVYAFNNLSQFSSIIHGISSKAFGSMKDAESLQIDRNALILFAHEIGIPDDIICMKQIHSGNVAVIENADILQIPETDCLLTGKKHLSLAVLTADCLPVFFYDPQKKIIGVAHAGYRGLLNHIIGNTIGSFTSRFKSNPEDIIVGIGPGIERDCYEVGKELINKFTKTFPGFQNIYKEHDGNFFLDLKNIALQTLLKEGILMEHIEVMNICTKCNPDFYSYRGGDGDKRFVSLLGLV
jgi:purine-nucleoside/S-methyl-5'-thioadenosine phosphorylase / adenosine deaminase